MLVLITYDVNTENKLGRKRLSEVAKTCEKYGQRVQNSVFECRIDESQFVVIKNILVSMIDKDKDSLRFYKLGNNYSNKVLHFGSKREFNVDEPMIL